MYKAFPSALAVVRQPLLPVDTYLAAQQQLADGHPLDSILRSIYAALACQEAIYYASPTLHKQLLDWLGGQPASADYLLTLYKYFVRLTTRATPFGLFAGVGMAQWTDASVPDTADVPPKRAVVRLSTDYLCHLVTLLVQVPPIRSQLTYRPNATLCRGGQSFRYVGFSEQDGQLTYYQQEVPADPILEQVLDTARPGATVAQLGTCIEQSNVPPAEAADYIDALIDNQLLITDLGVSLTGEDAFDRLIDQLDQLAGCQPLTDRLRQVRRLLEAGVIDTFAQIDDLLAPLGPTMAVAVQCDAGLAAPPPLPPALREQLNRLMPGLLRLHQPVDTAALASFRSRFYERFGEQSVPLLLALDPDSGIGYGEAQSLLAPWLSGQTWAAASTHTDPNAAASLPQAELLSRYAAALHQAEPIIQLTPQDLEAALPAPPETTLPYHAYVFLSLTDQADADEPLVLLKGMGGPSAVNLLGRFAHLDPQLERQLCHLTAREQAAYPDTLLAELVHLPESRVGNMLRRPQLRPYEIPILTSATVPQTQQFQLNDLLVAVPGGQRIVLYTRESGKPILPRLSTAHNVHGGHLAHYRFLYDLQHQHESLRIGWQWGPLSRMPFLPRVQLDTLILARAQWHVPASVFASETQWATWRHTYRVARFVRLGEGDNELMIDTEVAFSLPILAQSAKRLGYVTLLEALLPTGQSAQVRWCREVVLPLEASRWVRQASALPQPLPANRQAQRWFLPGSSWTYLKVYAGPGILDALVLNEVGQLIAELRTRNLIESWFFVRYADPGIHLRIRVYSQIAHVGDVIRTMNRWITTCIQADSRIYRVQFDTYEREIERYGLATIERCEAWFGTESDVVLQLLGLADDNPTDVSRLRLGCLAVHRLLLAWQLSYDEQIRIVEVWRDQFLREFEGGKALRDEMNAQFRQYKSLLDLADPVEESPLVDLLDTYQREAGRFCTDYQTLAGADAAHTVLGSISHMLLNRLFADDQRRHELIVYAYLHKLLKQWRFKPV